MDSILVIRNSRNQCFILKFSVTSRMAGSGFLVNLNTYDFAKKQMSDLRKYSWVDSKTRGVFIDSAFYNSNLEAWLVSRYGFQNTAV